MLFPDIEAIYLYLRKYLSLPVNIRSESTTIDLSISRQAKVLKEQVRKMRTSPRQSRDVLSFQFSNRRSNVIILHVLLQYRELLYVKFQVSIKIARVRITRMTKKCMEGERISEIYLVCDSKRREYATYGSKKRGREST